MRDPFETIDKIWREEDAFDEVLKGNLFEAINDLQDISGNDPIWAKIVFAILFDYLMSFFPYHFRFSYGNPEASKPERQHDLEQHIRKLLRTQARELISKVCISSLHGRGWQTLYGIRPWRFSFTLNPLKLFRRFLARMSKIFLYRIQKAPLGARLGLEVFSLFDGYTAEEFNELMLYVQQHSRNKLQFAFNEWEILYVVRLMARPQALLQPEHDKFVDQILSIEFTREDIRAQVLAELAKSSDKAIAALDAYKSSDLVDQLVTSAHINPLSMKNLISSVASYSFGGYNTHDVLGKLGRLEKSSAEVLLQTARSEESVYSSAVLVATHFSALTIEARELLTSHMDSPDPHLRYLVACALLQTARQGPVERKKIFNSILEIAIGPKYLEVTQEAYSRRDPFQKMVVQFLLDLAERDPSLIRTLLVALRTTWKNEFANTLGRFFSGCEMTDDLLDKLVDLLLDGNLSEFRMSVSQLCPEMHDLTITDALDRIATNDLIFYYWNNDSSPEADLVRTCMGYTIRVWPCLAFLIGHISKLKAPHFAVIAALLALDKPSRSELKSMPVSRSYSQHPEDSYVNICQDLSLAIRILERLDEEYILNLLTDLEHKADYRTREQIMRSLRFFPRANPAIMSLIKKGLADPEREVCQAAQESLYCSSYLDVDGVELIVETVLSPSEQLRTAKSDNLVEHPQPIAPSAIPRVVELLRKSSDLTSDEVREVWLSEYCLNVLNSAQQEGSEFIELYKQKLLASYSNDDLRRHLRPYLILALGRVRPVTSETVEMLLNFTKPGKARLMIRSLRDLEFPELKMAAAIALSEIGADLNNGIDWNKRETIANHLLWSAKQPLPSKSTFVGGKEPFPEDPNEAMYQSAKTMAQVMNDHRLIERGATKGIRGLG